MKNFCIKIFTPSKTTAFLFLNIVFSFLSNLAAEDFLQNGNLVFSNSRSRWASKVSAIMIHTTGTMKAEEYLQKVKDYGYGIHYFIYKNGEEFATSNPPKEVFTCAPGVDERAIHIALEGTESEILDSENQFQKLKIRIRSLSKEHGIPLENKWIGQKKGVFTHLQSKMRYGSFITLDSSGGEKVLQSLFRSIGGRYYPEIEWEDRYGDWILRKENPVALKQKEFEKGRGLTKPKKIEIDSLEKDEDGFPVESRRVKYLNRGTISPTCTVLHFTAIPTYWESLETLERRRLTASIMIDTDGKAYQLLDSLFEYPSSAAGTNEKCIQIEIVGLNEEALLKNEKQTKKVVQVLKDLSKKFQFTIQNEKIESFSGVYSHTQAKKKFGKSVWLFGKDFDPGESYMKKVLEKADGTYFPEEKWYDRLSTKWAILYIDFQP